MAAAISAPNNIQRNSFIFFSFRGRPWNTAIVSPHLARHHARIAHRVLMDHAGWTLRPRLSGLRTDPRRAGDARTRAAGHTWLPRLLRLLLRRHRSLLLRLRL